MCETKKSGMNSGFGRYAKIFGAGYIIGGSLTLAFLGVASASSSSVTLPHADRTEKIASDIVNAMPDHVKKCAAKEFSTLQKHGIEIDGKKLMSVIAHCKR